MRWCDVALRSIRRPHANDSLEVIQEFVICESSAPPPCLVWRSSAATGRAASHAGLHCFPFSTRNSEKTRCQRCPLDSTSLADAHLLKILHPVAQYLGLTRKRRRFGEEGSPLDACFIFALLIAGVCVLLTRQVPFAEIVRNNGWLVIFVTYCFISILWSDFPLISFKRWIKMFGHPIMALIVLTEPNPEEALIQLMKRCAYVIVPVSVLFIKYFLDLGVRYDPWTGAQMRVGITTGKNELGAVCLIFGFFFFWYLLQIWRTERSARRRNELRLIAGFLLMIGWLFWKAHSATSIICFFVGIMVVVLRYALDK